MPTWRERMKEASKKHRDERDARLEWNEDMEAAPKTGFYVLVKWPGMISRYGILVGWYDGAWRQKPKGEPVPTPTAWRWRPQGPGGSSL